MLAHPQVVAAGAAITLGASMSSLTDACLIFATFAGPARMALIVGEDFRLSVCARAVR
jgi:hypothetical protein